MGAFEDTRPRTESYWRAVILFGQNSASYKFALGKALLELASAGKTFVGLDELAFPFSQRVAEYLKSADKQGQRPTGPFLDACRQFNRGEITLAQLQATTVRHGFANVIDAFHVVNGRDIPSRFFEDRRKDQKGIALTDELLALVASSQFENLPSEVEARWKLVETAWELNVGRHLLQVQADDNDQLYVIDRARRRRNVTPVRDALSGYQKGTCFYCFRDITIAGQPRTMADVDHFFPWTLGRDRDLRSNLNGVWNLVLACKECIGDRGASQGGSPSSRILRGCRRGNNFLISGHHPLRETLIAQTSSTEAQRTDFLRERDRKALSPADASLGRHG